MNERIRWNGFEIAQLLHWPNCTTRISFHTVNFFINIAYQRHSSLIQCHSENMKFYRWFQSLAAESSTMTAGVGGMIFQVQVKLWWDENMRDSLTFYATTALLTTAAGSRIVVGCDMVVGVCCWRHYYCCGKQISSQCDILIWALVLRRRVMLFVVNIRSFNSLHGNYCSQIYTIEHKALIPSIKKFAQLWFNFFLPFNYFNFRLALHCRRDVMIVCW